MWKLPVVTVGIFLIGPLIQSMSCLKLTTVEVPNHSVAGNSVLLSCHFDMEGDELYSVKWYKGISEFYRFLPKDHPPAQVYAVHGVDVNLTASTENTVVLKNVSLLSSGIYRCEVSAEAPSFITVYSEKEMNVMALPSDGPKITGGQPKYNIGDIVRVNCTCSESKPAAMLSWTINSDTAPKEYLREYPPIIHESGLETSVLGLNFKVLDSHFRTGEMKLRCMAAIAPLYHQSNEESVTGGSPGLDQALASKISPGQGNNPVSANQRNNGCSTITHSLFWNMLAILRLLYQG